MKKDLLYLHNIIESINIIERHLNKINLEKFSNSILLQDAVSKRLEEIGENIKKISNKIKSESPSVKWEEYVDTRNFLTHVYQMLNVKRLWKIVKEDLPILKKEIEKIIKEVQDEK